MKNLKGILFLAALLTLVMGANAMAASNSVLLMEVNDTTIKRAVYGAYLSAVVGPLGEGQLNIDTAITVSNCTETKSDVSIDLFGDREGKGGFQIFLWTQNGDMLTHTSGDVPGNQGEDWDGYLAPGATWTGLLSEIIDAMPVKEPKIDTAGIFQGYAWVCSDFDCLAGTYSVTVFGAGFTQAFEFLPGMGQGGMFGGIPLP